MPSAVLAFFEAYRSGFNALDGVAVAGLYAEPSAIAQDGVLTYWPTRGQVEDNMIRLCQSYREGGYRSASFEEGAYLEQGPDYAVADLCWRIEWNSDKAPWEFRTTYNLVRSAEGWRVLLCTAYTESKLSSSAAG